MHGTHAHLPCCPTLCLLCPPVCTTEDLSQMVPPDSSQPFHSEGPGMAILAWICGSTLFLWGSYAHPRTRRRPEDSPLLTLEEKGGDTHWQGGMRATPPCAGLQLSPKGRREEGQGPGLSLPWLCSFSLGWLAGLRGRASVTGTR